MEDDAQPPNEAASAEAAAPAPAPAAALEPGTSGAEASEVAPGIDRILDIPLTVHVELGKKRIKISELMELGAGAVLELDAQAGASLAIYANQTLLAHGEAVVVGERYGVRITDIASPAERVRRLGGELSA